MLCPICKSELPQETALEGSGSRRCVVCGATLDQYFEKTETAILETIGRFIILHTLGEGGFGTVYKAKDAKLDRIVAIKVLRPNRVGRQDMEQRLVREAKAASLLNHPGIVKVFDLEELGPIKVLIEEFVEGDTLEFILRHKKLTLQERLQVVTRIADALAYAHEHKVIHRDIKPSNIMLDGFGQPRILDFGLAKREGLDVSFTEEGQLLGTIIYMSPEQANGHVDLICGASDQYSLGVILYQLMTGELPFRGSGNMVLRQIVTEEPPSPRTLSDAVTRDLETICLKAMAKKISDRYASTADFAADLRRYLNHEPVAARPVGVVGKLQRWARRHRTLSASIAVISAILILASLVSTYFAFKSFSDLQDRLKAEKNSQASQLKLLLEGDAHEIRPVVQAIWKDLSVHEADLRQLQNDPLLDQRKRARTLLALCEKEPALADHLYTFIDQLAPPELFLVNDLIPKPPGQEQENALWNRLKNPQTPAQQRLMAAVVLAKAKPRHANWQNMGQPLVNDLLDPATSLQLPLWMQQLEPLWPLLQKPLALECSKKTDARRASQAITIYLQLFKNDVPSLVQLLGEVLPELAMQICDHLKSMKQPELVLAELRKLMEPGSARTPLIQVPAGLAEPPPALKQKLEANSGVLHHSFAIVSALPWAQVDATQKELAALGYRPVRFRPYPTAHGLRAAALWYRDALPGTPAPWDFAIDLSQDELKRRAWTCRSKGWQPIEVVAYEVEPRPGVSEVRYAWISAPSNEPAPWRLVLDQKEDSVLESNLRWLFVDNANYHDTGILDLEKGILPVTLNARHPLRGQTTFSFVVSEAPQQRGLESSPSSFQLAMPEDHFRQTLMDFNIHHDLAWGLPPRVLTRVEYFTHMRLQAQKLLQNTGGNSGAFSQAALGLHRAQYELDQYQLSPLARATISYQRVYTAEQEITFAMMLARQRDFNLALRCLNRLVVESVDVRQILFLHCALNILAPRGHEVVEDMLKLYTRRTEQYQDGLGRYWHARLLCIAAEVAGISNTTGKNFADQAFTLCQQIFREGTGLGYECDKFWSRDFEPIAERLEPLIQQQRRQLRYCTTWSPARGIDQRLHHGETADLALTQWNRWIQEGFIPHTISAIEWQGKVRLMSAWRQSRPTPDQDGTAVNRRTNAIIALAQLGEIEELWKALDSTSLANVNVELANQLVFRCTTGRISPQVVIQKLQTAVSPVFKQRLLTILGQYQLADLGSEQQSLLALLKQWLVEDSSAGVHSTCDWLLRTWKQSQVLQEAWKNQVRPLETLGDRDWYRSKGGHEYVVFRNPAPFYMGISVDDSEATFPARERPHFVRIGHSFALATREVTRREFIEFKPLHDPGDRRFGVSSDSPVGNISWSDAARYCNWLSRTEGIPQDQWCYVVDPMNGLGPAANYLDRTGYRLPLESEYEYACRGNSRLIRPFGNSTSLMHRLVWFRDNSNRQIHPVGVLPPNGFGLFDIQGNASEWVSDQNNYYPPVLGQEVIQDHMMQLAPNRLAGARSNGVLRSLSWGAESYFMRVSQRSSRFASSTAPGFDLGFRVARTIK